MEQKYQIGTNSGNILWNINLILLDIAQFQIKQFNVQELYKNNPFHGNVEYAMTTDMTVPLIVVELCDKKTRLIDGNHRLYHAMKLDIKNISVYYLRKEEHIQYIEDYNEQLYNQIISELNFNQ